MYINDNKFFEIEKAAIHKLEANKDRPLSEAAIEAQACLDVLNELKKNAVWVERGDIIRTNTMSVDIKTLRELGFIKYQSMCGFNPFEFCHKGDNYEITIYPEYIEFCQIIPEDGPYVICEVKGEDHLKELCAALRIKS